MRITERGFPAKDRVVYLLDGLGPAIKYRVHNNNLLNLERALKERVFFVKKDGEFVTPPKPSSDAFYAQSLNTFFTHLKKYLPHPARMEPSEFPKLYAGRKRTIYERAATSLLELPLEKKDAEISVFVKAEKVNVTETSDKAPRAIQPRAPRYNVELGCYTKPIEKRIYRAIGKVMGMTTVAKGLNAEERGELIERKWTRFNDPVAVGLDASRFDQHCSASALKWEHSVYKYCYGGDKDLKRLLNWQVYNSGRGYTPDGKVKYKTDGCRMSGDMNTALGNCLLMCGMVYSYSLLVGLEGEIELINDGDDCVVFMESSNLAKFLSCLETWFTSVGFTMKVEKPVYTLEKVEFCQAHPVFDGEKYIMVRDIRAALVKDTYSIKPIDTEGVMRKWLIAIGDGGMSLTGGIPIWQEFYNTLATAGSKLAPSKTRKSQGINYDPTMDSGMRRLAERMNRNYTTIHPRARYSFWLAFDIAPDEQLAMEGFYRSRGSAPIWSAPEYRQELTLPFFP